ncbi:MAG: hypothetical protein WC955_06120 [Elusimicrobiota bacterium]
MAEPGEKVLFSIWYTTNDSTATYRASVIPRIDDKPTGEYIEVFSNTSDGEWRELSLIYTARARVNSLSFNIKPLNTHKHARIWLDDVIISKLPVSKLSFLDNENVVINKSGEDAPE